LPAATVGRARDACLWDFPSGRLRAELAGHHDAVRQCVALHDRLFVTSSDDKSVRVSDVIEREEVFELYAGSQGRPLIGVGAGYVAILDGDKLTVAAAHEFERLIETSAEADSPGGG
jgi:WD40 repeat protein